MEQTISTKGYPRDLIEKVGDIAMMGGYSNEVAVEIIDLVVKTLKDK